MSNGATRRYHSSQGPNTGVERQENRTLGVGAVRSRRMASPQKPDRGRQSKVRISNAAVSIAALLAGVALSCRPAATLTKGRQVDKVLYSLDTAIDEYTFDRGKAPKTLDDLVRAHYLGEIPVDPSTGSRTTWRIESGRVRSGSAK